MVARIALFLIIAAFVLSGCIMTKDYVQGPALPPAPLPDYAPGDRFTYDSGITETVLAADDKTGLVTWKRGKSTEQVRPASFIFPSLEWSRRTAKGRFETSAELDSLWPLGPEKSQYFAGVAHSFRKSRGTWNQTPRAYDCWVAGTKSITVAAGTFDTYKVTCRRYVRGRKLSRVYNWYYAPAVGHYVQKETMSRLGGLNSRVKLVSVIRADADLATPAKDERDRMLTEALETWVSGKTGTWTHTASGAHGAITMAATFRTRSGTYCRRFSLDTYTSAGSRLDPGLACRTAAGWRLY